MKPAGIQLPQEVLQRQAEQEMEDQAGRISATVALPGATFDAFAPQPNIRVGKFEVRPFYDADYEWLQVLDHPLQKTMASAMDGKKNEESNPIIRGPQAWELCWMMTTPVEEVDAAFAKGVEEVRRLAREKCKLFRIAQMQLLITAIYEQASIYWSPVIGYDTKVEKKEGEAAAPQANPPLSGQP